LTSKDPRHSPPLAVAVGRGHFSDTFSDDLDAGFIPEFRQPASARLFFVGKALKNRSSFAPTAAWNQFLGGGLPYIINMSPEIGDRETRPRSPAFALGERVLASGTNMPNHFLASLSSSDSDLLRPHLREENLTLRSVLFRPEEQVPRVYFPTDGIISLVVPLSDGFMVEAGMFGRNSVVGGGSALDGRVAINQAIVQSAGSSLTVDTGVLRRFASESITLRTALMHHELASYAMTQQVAACNARHELEERLCRWLMLTRDLLGSDTLPLTQEFLAQMLGVQRTSLSSLLGPCKNRA